MGLENMADRLYHEGEVVALRMMEGAALKDYYFRVDTAEYPNNRSEFSLGSATALAAAGTGWNNITDSSNVYILEPQESNLLFQYWYGIGPSIARLYRRYPPGVDRGALLQTRNPGVDPEGYIDGVSSPLRVPSPITEGHSIKGLRPSFYGYHPYATPSTITVRLTFYVATYGLTYLKGSDVDRTRRMRLITVGGRVPPQSPSWVRDLAPKNG